MQRDLPRTPPPGTEMEHLSMPMHAPDPATRRPLEQLEIVPIEQRATRPTHPQDPCHLAAFIWIVGTSAAVAGLFAGGLLLGLELLIDLASQLWRSTP